MTIDLHIPKGNYNSIVDLLNAMNRSITDVVEKVPYPKNGYIGIKDAYQADLYRTKEDLWRIRGGSLRRHIKGWPGLYYDDIKNKIEISLPSHMWLEFSPALANILGFSKSRNPVRNDEDMHMMMYSDRSVDIRAGINSVYVYCDALEHVPVGDTKAPLLRIVDARGLANHIIHATFDTPRFIPLQKKQFDSIEIDIRDCFGENIPFESGEVVVILEFRRAQNPYFL